MNGFLYKLLIVKKMANLTDITCIVGTCVFIGGLAVLSYYAGHRAAKDEFETKG